MSEIYNKVKEILKKYNQEQLLVKYEELSEENKKKLLNQILEIDFELINKLYKTTILTEYEKNEILKEKNKIEPIVSINKETLTNDQKEYYMNLGIEQIKKGKLAAVTMAGGQGTRLRTQRTKRYFYIRNKS